MRRVSPPCTGGDGSVVVLIVARAALAALTAARLALATRPTGLVLVLATGVGWCGRLLLRRGFGRRCLGRLRGLRGPVGLRLVGGLGLAHLTAVALALTACALTTGALTTAALTAAAATLTLTALTIAS